jgi:hypothetical protein
MTTTKNPGQDNELYSLDTLVLTAQSEFVCRTDHPTVSRSTRQVAFILVHTQGVLSCYSFKQISVNHRSYYGFRLVSNFGKRFSFLRIDFDQSSFVATHRRQAVMTNTGIYS